jgi:nitrate reductase delta subunit
VSRIRRAAVDDGQALPRKIAGILLCYPDQRVYGRLDDVDTALPAVADPAQREPLARAARWLSESGATAAARHHVEVFDFTRRCSPYLTYYRYGDTRQRGMALLALKHTYRRAGLEPTGDELPDYLPAVLEFAALAAGGGALLRTHRAGLELLRLALHDKDSPYAHVLDAVAAGLPTLTAKQAADVRRLAADGPPREEVGLDPVGTEPFAPPEYLYAGLTAGPPS